MQTRPFAIRSLLDRISRDHAEEARAKGVSLVWEASTAIVETDPVLMERILCNSSRTPCAIPIVGGSSSVAVDAAAWRQCRYGIRGEESRATNGSACSRNIISWVTLERDRTKGLGLGLAIVRRLTDLLESS